MALQSFVIDPLAEVLTGDEIVAKINTDTTTTITKAGVVAAAARPIVDAEITAAKVAVGVAKANLDAVAATARGYVKTLPVIGQFPVVATQRTATGQLEVTYDNVPIV